MNFKNIDVEVAENMAKLVQNDTKDRALAQEEPIEVDEPKVDRAPSTSKEEAKEVKELQSILSKINSLEEEVKTLKEEIKDLKEENEDLKEETKGLKKTLSEEVDRITFNQRAIHKEIKESKKLDQINFINNRIEKLENFTDKWAKGLPQIEKEMEVISDKRRREARARINARQAEEEKEARDAKDRKRRAEEAELRKLQVK